MIPSVQAAIANIPTKLKRDSHLADCELAKRGGPEATLACAYCERARWMHRTRHDTCGQFCYVTEYNITDDQIIALRHIELMSHEVKVACSRALNEFGLAAPALVRDAKRLCVATINQAKNAMADAATSKEQP